MEKMTGRERMMIALANGQPDRVPVAPDISVMVPARLTGKPFWETHMNSNPPMWRAYIDAARYFGIDAWCIWGAINYKRKIHVEIELKVEKTADRWVITKVYHTPEGDLSTTTVCTRDNPSVNTEKFIKNFADDFKKFKCIFSDVIGYDSRLYDEQKEYLGDQGIMGVIVDTPGIQIFGEYFNGNHTAAIYAMVDEPDLFEELVEITHRTNIQKTEMVIDAGADSILTGGSGSITMQSPDIWYKYSFPTLKKQTELCKQAGIISGVHSCGKERFIVEKCASETELDYINPLEVPPQGDCDLSELKEKFGSKIALMGNLHTTDIMLRGTRGDVRRESLKAILSAGVGGGFVLSTGDQCGRDTPDENLFAMVKTVEDLGVYPLDIEKIKNEIAAIGG